MNEDNQTMSEKDTLINYGIGIVLIATSFYLLVKAYKILKDN
ncbi:MAG: hypothetical protein RLZ10_2128 [Bacteroidota bacterium]|jgi:hypothetical protein